MNDRKKIEKVLDMIQKSKVIYEHVTPDEMYEEMSEYNLLELAEDFSQIINLIADIKDVLEEDDFKESDILEVTLLSVEEAIKLPREMREAECSWWLRSPGYYDLKAAFVLGVNGYVNDYGDYVEIDFGVRPALKLKPSLFKKGDYFSYKGYGWDVIDNNLALCRTIVGKCAFREDYEASDAKDYESSDIKKWLSDWWEEDWWEDGEGRRG